MSAELDSVAQSWLVDGRPRGVICRSMVAMSDKIIRFWLQSAPRDLERKRERVAKVGRQSQTSFSC